jgi:acetyl-CoA carboxylase biotin carboxyl carrier protein
MPTIDAHITGTIWKINVGVGDEVQEGDEVLVLESMKIELPVEAEVAGTVAEILCDEGTPVAEGQPLIRLT